MRSNVAEWHVVLVTGARSTSGTDAWSRFHALIDLHQASAVDVGRSLVLLHGGCPDESGIDSFADARDCDQVIKMQAAWDQFGRAAGPKRNAAMVALAVALKTAGAEVFAEAFPRGRSPGTRGCIRLIERAGIPVRVTELE